MGENVSMRRGLYYQSEVSVIPAWLENGFEKPRFLALKNVSKNAKVQNLDF